MANNKELEKELKAIMAEMMSYTNKRLSEVEKNIKSYIDKEIAETTKVFDTKIEKNLADFLKQEVHPTIFQSAQANKKMLGDVERSVIAYINKKVSG